MTWAQAAADAQLGTTEEFGGSVSYTPKAGVESHTVPATYRSPSQLMDGPTRVPVSSRISILGVRVSDLPSEPKEGDRVLVGDPWLSPAVEFAVVREHFDGHGWVTLSLRRVAT